jgi:glucose/arabinose dehydrogenase
MELVRLGLAVAALIATLAGSAWSADPPRTRPAANGVRLLLLGRFSQPTYVAAPPGDRDRRFVVERAGRIRVVRGGTVLAQPFLDIRGRVQTGGESGLLSMAFAPDYAQSRRFYVYFTDNRGFIREEEFQRSESDPDRANTASRRLVFLQRHHRFNHKGGQVQFGPDGRLYMGLGDGGGAGDPDHNAQNRRRLLGKLLRIDPRVRGARPRVFAYGLRNPYRFSFDRRRGDLTIADVGQDAVEEVDFVPRRRGARAPRGGQNFGWPVFEGRRRYSSGRVAHHVPPVLQRTRRQGACTIIGGYVIRDRSLGRSLYGRYVYGDLCDSRLRTARLARPRARGDRALGIRVPMLVSFGEDAQGRLYAVSLRGPVYRVAPR